jgi:DNA-binding transcriptional LysR family regulator
MELRRLRYFCAVAEERHVGRAAEVLGIRATSLSQQIITLERELGTALFVRTPGGMVPTKAGLALIPQARSVLVAADRARQAVLTVAAAERPLRIGVTPGAPRWLPRRLWSRVGPALELVDLQNREQFEALARGGLDAGVVVLPLHETMHETMHETVHEAGWAQATISDVALGVLVGPGHRLAGHRTVAWDALAGSELLWFPRAYASGYHDAVLDACRAAGWRPAGVRERQPRRGLFVAELTGGGDVVALRPAEERDPNAGLVWIPLADNPPRLRHALVWSAQHPSADVLADTARHLAHEAATHGRAQAPPGQD